MVLVGHAALEPVQSSAGSHPPVDARQTVDDEAKPFAGHAPAAPLQVSATSHGPDAVRHVVPIDTNWQDAVQHDVDVPFAAP